MSYWSGKENASNFIHAYWVYVHHVWRFSSRCNTSQVVPRLHEGATYFPCCNTTARNFRCFCWTTALWRACPAGIICYHNRHDRGGVTLGASHLGGAGLSRKAMCVRVCVCARVVRSLSCEIIYWLSLIYPRFLGEWLQRNGQLKKFRWFAIVIFNLRNTGD